MESKVEQTDTTTFKTGAGPLAKEPPSTEQPWQEWVAIGVDFLAKVPDQVGSFFSDYKKPLSSVGILLAAIVTVYVTLAVLDAINDIPLLSPVLELVGLAYTAWFVVRYLLKESTRQELLMEIESLKTQIMGKN